MNPAAPFYLEKFTDVSGGTSYTFPLNVYQLDDAQTIRTAFQNVIGASYAVDLLGSALAPKDNARDSHRFLIVEASGDDVNDELDDLRHKLYSVGQGKLYKIDSSSVERWAYARLTAMPSTTWKAGDLNFMAVILDWTILSDWYSATPYSNEFAITTDPETITVPNGGDATVYNAVFTIKGPFNNPALDDTSSGYQINNARVSAVGTDWIKIDAGQGVVLFSNDSGATYFGDFVNVGLGTQQIQLMVLTPGDNSIDVTGLAGGSILVEFSPAFD